MLACTLSSAALAAGAVLFVSSAANADLAYATTLEGTLVTFDTATPGTLLSGVAVSGMQPNEVVRGIDFRPATGELFVLGSFSRLYTLNTVTGAATQVGGTFSTPLNGSQFGFGFNPTVDRIRIVSDADQNLRVHPGTGAVAFVDGTLAYASGDSNFGVNPNVTHAAYTNSFAGATSSTLYVIDTGLDILAVQNANVGSLTTVGSIGTDVSDMGGFDISANGNIGYVAVRNVALARTTFWTINLSTGAGTMVGEVGGGAILTSLAVVPSPGAGAALALASMAVVARRRR